MNHVINIAVKNKYAQLISGEYICGNSDFTVVFDFDEEWADLITKTARFITDAGETVDVLFDGDTCGVPVLLKAHKIFVGVYAGDIRTSTPAYIPARKSILCDAGTPRPQTPDIYAQIISDIDGLKANNKFTLRKLRDFAYEMTCLDIDYEAALEYYASREAEVPPACSTIRNGNYIGRNLDWTYDNKATFVVHIPHSEERRASVNLCGGLNELSEEFVRSANVSKAYKVLPCNAYDGINESGVVASMLVVPTDKGINRSVPIEDQREELPAPMLVRYILDHFDTAHDAADYIRKHVAVYFPAALHDMQYELHFMIADANDTYCLEFINNAAVIIDISEHPILTNFHISGTQLNDDGTVYTPDTQDETHNAHITNGITHHGAGLERFNLLQSRREFSTSKSDMRFTMDELKYSRAYQTAYHSARWLTEFVGGALTCYAPPYAFEGIMERAGEAYADRDRNDPKTWHTVHSSVYDIRNRTVSVVFQEDGEEIEFSVSSDTAPKARAMFVTYGDETVSFSELHAALEDHVPVYCVKNEGTTGIYEAVEYDELSIRFHRAAGNFKDNFVIASAMEFGSGTNWNSRVEPSVTQEYVDSRVGTFQITLQHDDWTTVGEGSNAYHVQTIETAQLPALKNEEDGSLLCCATPESSDAMALYNIRIMNVTWDADGQKYTLEYRAKQHPAENENINCNMLHLIVKTHGGTRSWKLFNMCGNAAGAGGHEEDQPGGLDGAKINGVGPGADGNYHLTAENLGAAPSTLARNVTKAYNRYFASEEHAGITPKEFLWLYGQGSRYVRADDGVHIVFRMDVSKDINARIYVHVPNITENDGDLLEGGIYLGDADSDPLVTFSSTEDLQQLIFFLGSSKIATEADIENALANYVTIVELTNKLKGKVTSEGARNIAKGEILRMLPLTAVGSTFLEKIKEDGKTLIKVNFGCADWLYANWNQFESVNLVLYICHRRHGLKYRWRHPLNWDEESADPEENRYGYGMIAGMERDPQHYPGEVFPAVPRWMQHNGFMETKIPLKKTDAKCGFYMIDPGFCFLPMLKPYDCTQPFTKKNIEFMGTQPRTNTARRHLPAMVTWGIEVDGKPVGKPMNTLRVGCMRIEGATQIANDIYATRPGHAFLANPFLKID